MRWHARGAQAIGLYSLLRWLQLHVFRRGRLAHIERDVEFFSEMISPGDLVFDVGANRGDMTDVFLRLGATVVAFEPQEEMCETVKARFGSNPNLTLLPYAVGAEAGEATLYVNQDHTGASSLLEDWPDHVTDARKVPVVTLDAMIERFGVPRYIKIDVEGFEADVLAGLSQRIPLVSFEQSRDHPEGPANVRRCMDLLARFGSLEVNLTPAETLEFSLDKEISASRFLADYPDRFAGFEHRYGDVFVKSTPLP